MYIIQMSYFNKYLKYNLNDNSNRDLDISNNNYLKYNLNDNSNRDLDIWHAKYLKYKNKYLKLKNNKIGGTNIFSPKFKKCDKVRNTKKNKTGVINYLRSEIYEKDEEWNKGIFHM